VLLIECREEPAATIRVYLSFAGTGNFPEPVVRVFGEVVFAAAFEAPSPAGPVDPDCFARVVAFPKQIIRVVGLGSFCGRDLGSLFLAVDEACREVTVVLVGFDERVHGRAGLLIFAVQEGEVLDLLEVEVDPVFLQQALVDGRRRLAADGTAAENHEDEHQGKYEPGQHRTPQTNCSRLTARQVIITVTVVFVNEKKLPSTNAVVEGSG